MKIKPDTTMHVAAYLFSALVLGASVFSHFRSINVRCSYESTLTEMFLYGGQLYVVSYAPWALDEVFDISIEDPRLYDSYPDWTLSGRTKESSLGTIQGRVVPISLFLLLPMTWLFGFYLLKLRRRIPGQESQSKVEPDGATKWWENRRRRNYWISIAFVCTTLLILLTLARDSTDYPASFVPLAVIDLEDEEWRAAEVSVELSDCHWRTGDRGIMLEGLMTVANDSPYRAYYLTTDFEQFTEGAMPLFVEGFDDTDSVREVFSGTICLEIEHEPAFALAYMEPGERVSVPLKWPSGETVLEGSGRHRRICDYFVRAGATVRMRVVLRSDVTFSTISLPHGQFVDMRKFASGPGNAFIGDMFSQWVILEVPE